MYQVWTLISRKLKINPMPTQDDSVVLVISSQVAASRVGGSASCFTLERMGHRAIHLPTTLLGRHPGWGVPGGDIVKVETLFSIWEALCEQHIPARTKAVVCGYMGRGDHIAFAEAVMDTVRTANPKAVMMVDPIMGDAPGGLYIDPDIARAMTSRLVPRAHILTPNLWEMGFIAGTDLKDESAIISAAKTCRAEHVLISSVRRAKKIGALAVTKDGAWYAGHTEFDGVPRGPGDVLAAHYLASILSGTSARAALGASAGALAGLMQSAKDLRADELPLVRTQDMWTAPKSIKPKKISP